MLPNDVSVSVSERFDQFDSKWTKEFLKGTVKRKISDKYSRCSGYGCENKADAA